MLPPLTSNTVEWGTPQDLFDAYDRRFDFTLDACASDHNHKCARYFTREDSCLEKNLEGERVWMNPPYGNRIPVFLKWAFEQSMRGNLFCCLLPARTDTRWFHTYVLEQDVGLEFVQGRVKFTPAPLSAQRRAELEGMHEELFATGQLPRRQKYIRDLLEGNPVAAPFSSMVVIFRPPNLTPTIKRRI